MDYKNGYKVVYEVAANGERTFYASKSDEYPARDEAGNIIENEMNTKLASFVDNDFAGKTIYEYKGEFYVADTIAAKFDEDGVPTGSKIEGFDKILVEETPANTNTPAVTEVKDEEPAGESKVETEEDDEEPEVDTEE